LEHPSIIFKIVCPDRPGLVSLLTSWISNYGGNIKHSDHHTDQDAGLFLSRIEWNSNNESFNRDEIYKEFEKISDEVSITSGYDFNPQNAILATSGKSKFEFDLPQNKFAWISSGKTEQKIIKRMKKASRLMITAYKQSGTRTTDDYSLMGFTKAYNAAKKSCT